MNFIDGGVLWLTKNSGRRRKDEMVNAMPKHRIKQVLCVKKIVLVIKSRLSHRFANLDEGCKMHHRIKVIGAK